MFLSSSRETPASKDTGADSGEPCEGLGAGAGGRGSPEHSCAALEDEPPTGQTAVRIGQCNPETGSKGRSLWMSEAVAGFVGEGYGLRHFRCLETTCEF